MKTQVRPKLKKVCSDQGLYIVIACRPLIGQSSNRKGNERPYMDDGVV